MLKRLLIVAVILTTLILSANAATSICPFDIPLPSNLPQGHYLVSKQTVGTCDGAMSTSEGTTYQDTTGQGLTNSYQFSAQAVGSTQYASTLTTDVNLVTSEKAIDQGAFGAAQIDESYFQQSINKSDNLTFCDRAYGGSYTVMSPGQFASATALNRPVDLVYQVAIAGPDTNNGMANGMSQVFLYVDSIEGFGNNGTYTATARQQTHQTVNWFGNFQYATVDSVRITHPIAPVSSSLTSLSQLKLGCAP